MRQTSIITWLLIIALFPVAAFCATSADEAEDAISRIFLAPGDVLDVRIPAEPDLSNQYTVAENGKLYFPIFDDSDIGSFDVSNCVDEETQEVRGCTAAEVEVMIREKLKIFYVVTDVTVELISYGVRVGYAISVYGEVQNSGSFRFNENMRLLDLLVQAGAFTENADLERVVLFRKDKRIELNIKNLVQGHDLANNIPIEAGDYMIVPSLIPKKKIKVLMLGFVESVGSYYLPEGSRILDALALAGGPSGRAGLGRSYIIRLVENKPTAVPVDIKALINRLDLAQNQLLQDGDVFFIPESSGVDILKIIMELTTMNAFKNMVDDDYFDKK